MELTTSYQLISSFNLTYGAIRTYAKYSSQSTPDNTTTYQLKQVYYCSLSGGYVGFDYGVGVLDGTQKVYNGYTRMYSGETTIQEFSRVIEHNADGSSPTKTVTTSWSASAGGGGSTSVDITFPTISRFPIVTDATDFNDTQNPTMYFTTNLMSYGRVHAYLISADGTEIYVTREDIGTVPLGRYTFELSSAERNLLLSKTVNSKTLTVRFALKTIAPDSTEYWSYVDRTMTVIDARPTFNVAYKDTNAVTKIVTGNNQKIIQNKSTLQFNISNATAQKGATLDNVKIIVNGVITTTSISTSSLDINIGTVNLNANTTVPVILTDSRGYSLQINVPVTILAYQKPTAIIDLRRKQNYYTETDITPDASYSSLDGNNTLTIEYKIKKTSEGSYGSYAPLTNNTTTTFNADNTYSWDVKVHLQDRLDENVYDLTLGVGLPIFFIDRLKRSIGLNCFPTGTNTVEANGIDLTNQYSFNEIKVGTWLNGKPIYRKCVALTSDNVNGASVSTGVADLEDMVKMWGIWNGTRPVPSASSNANYVIEMYYNAGDKKMYVITGSSIANALVRIYIEYTKTSD